VLGRFLGQGQRTPFIAEQTTRILEDRVRESTQIVKHAGPGRERIEYVSPPAMKGEIILHLGGRVFQYRLRPAPRLVEGGAPDEIAGQRLRALAQSMRDGTVHAQFVGRQVVAGRDAYIVEIRPAAGGGCRRLWIDAQNGVRLRHEHVDARGSVLSTSFFTRVDFSPTFLPSDFDPRALESAPSQVLPDSVPLADISEAEKRVGFRVREPWMPAGFRRTGVYLVGRGIGRAVALGYGDGVSSLRITQRLLPAHAARARKRQSGDRPVIRPGFAHWIAGDVLFTLAGPIRGPAVDRIVESLR
jgi:hypothetical protein